MAGDSPGQSCTGCCLAAGVSIAEIQLFQARAPAHPCTHTHTPLVHVAMLSGRAGPRDGRPDCLGAGVKTVGGRAQDSAAVTPLPTRISVSAATGPGSPVSATPAGYAVDGNESTAWTATATCGDRVLPPLVFDFGPANPARVDRYRFLPGPTAAYAPLRWMLEATDDGAAAGGDAFDAYGFCGAGMQVNATGACLCDAAGAPTCSTTGTYSPDCFCRSRRPAPPRPAPSRERRPKPMRCCGRAGPRGSQRGGA